ncbi:hypothetical protein, partial [Mesorhizobium sp.]|uniref:hypothetical protein n=1 Tax=Mesorhizobium sp. TaxID=1871066 RepID=UPI0025F1319A
RRFGEPAETDEAVLKWLLISLGKARIALEREIGRRSGPLQLSSEARRLEGMATDPDSGCTETDRPLRVLNRGGLAFVP